MQPTQTEHDAPSWLSTQQVADELGVTYKTVLPLIRSGELPAMYIGRGYRVKRTDLAELIERRTVQPSRSSVAIAEYESAKAS